MKKKVVSVLVVFLIFSFMSSCFSFGDLIKGGLDKDDDDTGFLGDGSEVLEDVLGGILGGKKESDNNYERKREEASKKEKLEAVVEASSNLAESVDKAKQDMSPDTEYYIGRSVAATILHEYPIYKNEVLTTYLNKICSALVLNSPKPYLYKGYFVAVIDSDEINAISTPGGHIFISRGLLQCANSEDAIAGVIAHELGHIQLGHSSEVIKSSRISDVVSSALSSLGAIGDAFLGDDFSKKDVENFKGLSDSVSKNLINVGFSHVQEFDADSYALKLMKNAGYNPYALIDMLEAIDKHTNSGKGWFKTHPNPKIRIREVENELEEAEYKVVDMSPRENRFEKIKNRL